ncbi:MAG: hypothetical protein JST51_17505 [Armatimonadetes bacterium]|nr:hypothetical protein [Armatimonadota bacterium]
MAKLTRPKQVILIAFLCVVIIVSCVCIYKRTWQVSEYEAMASQLKWETGSEGKLVVIAINMYTQDNDDRLPACLVHDVRFSLRLHEGKRKSANPNGGQFRPNPKVAGLRLSEDLSPDTILASEDYLWPEGTKCYVLADGQRKWFRDSDPKNWNPKASHAGPKSASKSPAAP